jgi:7-keto-8-aminopelargonate synthetase-like enzyme
MVREGFGYVTVMIPLAEEDLPKVLEAEHLPGQAVDEAVKMYLQLTGGTRDYPGMGTILSAVEPRIAEFHRAFAHLGSYFLTAVGVVVAVSNLKRLTGENYNIMRWIR